MSDFDQPSIRRAATEQESSLSEDAIAWFTRLRSAHCSLEERLAFESWRNRSPAHAAAFDEVCALWDDPALRAAVVEAAACDAAPSANARWHLYGAAAAAIAGLLIVAGLLELPLRLSADYWTSTGERLVVQLTDHSSVTLNTQSAINAEFDEAVRRVHLLKGEAFFQVSPNQVKAFVVQSHQLTARAVGTAFVVRKEPDGIRVTVTEGVVEVAANQSGSAPLQLTVGQQVAVGYRGPGPVIPIDTSQATAWIRGRLVIDDARLADVIDELRRYHPGTIQVWNRAVNDIRVSGSYNLADPAGVLTTLAQTLPIHMARFTDRLIILF